MPLQIYARHITDKYLVIQLYGSTCITFTFGITHDTIFGLRTSSKGKSVSPPKK